MSLRNVASTDTFVLRRGVLHVLILMQNDRLFRRKKERNVGQVLRCLLAFETHCKANVQSAQLS